MASAFADVAALGLSYSEEGGIFSATDDLSLDPTERCRQDKITDVCSCSMSDIIVLAEFSEIKGPIPLMTIPLTRKHEVDIDDFILKIMSIDYQANSSGHFRFSSDTQVLQTDVIEGVHAYVHYFSLSNIAARGFVRPLCLAYISKNRTKLESNVSILRDNFLKVSTVVKCENRGLFLEEVSLNLLYLKDIQHRYFQWKQKLNEEIKECSKEDDFFLGINIDQLHDQQTEYLNILHSAKNIPDSEEINELLSCWRSKFSTSEVREVNEYVTSIKKNLGSKPVILCQKASVHQLHQLKPIAIISPFGIAIGIWSLCLLHRYFEGCPLELKGGCFWSQDDDDSSNSTLKKEALTDDEFIQLLVHILPSKTGLLSGNNQHDSFHLDQENVLISGNEGSSSYYSAPESNEDGTWYPSECLVNSSNLLGKACLLPSTKTCHSSSDSLSEMGVKEERACRECPIIADECSSDSSDCVEHDSEVFGFPPCELWCRCIWNGNMETSHNYTGQKVLHFFQTFSKVAQHILYSFLIGRTVVIAGSNSIRHKVLNIISGLLYFVPVQKDSKYLRWHKGILVPAHIEEYKVIGLCVPERLAVHDLISPRDKNTVTILDVKTKQIFGPAYSGMLLSSLEEDFHKNFLSEESLILYLQAVFMKIREKVFLYQAISINRNSLTSMKCNYKTSSSEILNSLGIKGCDAQIVRNLRNFIVM